MAKKRKAPPLPKRGASIAQLNSYGERLKKTNDHNLGLKKAEEMYSSKIKSFRDAAKKAGTSFTSRKKKD